MNKLPYDNFNPQQFIVRDWLALDRTVLANERTLLAYMRTAFTLVISGLTFIKFFQHFAFDVVGYVFIASGVIIFIFGMRRYLQMLHHYRGLSRISDELMPDHLKKSMLDELAKTQANVE